MTAATSLPLNMRCSSCSAIGDRDGSRAAPNNSLRPLDSLQGSESSSDMQEFAIVHQITRLESAEQLDPVVKKAETLFGAQGARKKCV